MHTIIGLGNPGEKYRGTRHNIGVALFEHMVPADAWYQSAQPPVAYTTQNIAGTSVLCAKPLTYMNKSGEVLPYLKQKYDISTIILIHDDIDLPFGTLRISHGRGAGGHNGVQSMLQVTDEPLIRLRIGIAPVDEAGNIRKPSGGVFQSRKAAVSKFVLGKFSSREQSQLNAILKQAQEILTCIIAEGKDTAMNRYNKKATE